MNKINLAIKILHGLSITITTAFVVYFIYTESINNPLDNVQDALGQLLILTSFYWHTTIGLTVAVKTHHPLPNGKDLDLKWLFTQTLTIIPSIGTAFASAIGISTYMQQGYLGMGALAVYFVTMCANGAALALLPLIALLCWSIKKRRVKHAKASL